MILESALNPIGLIIGNILALTLPPKLASLAGIQDGVHNWLHALRVCRVGLHEVDEVETIGLILTRVLYSKVKPLGETLRAVVIFEIQIIFKWSDLYTFTQIATLEPRLKHERLICR